MISRDFSVNGVHFHLHSHPLYFLTLQSSIPSQSPPHLPYPFPSFPIGPLILHNNYLRISAA